MVAANQRMVLTFTLSPGQASGSVKGRDLLTQWKNRPSGLALIMDSAYEGDETRQLVLDLGFEPVVPPKSNRIN